MAYGSGLTVIVFALKQPVLIVYLITDVPALIPVTIPEDDPIVATPVLVLVQVPPIVVLLAVIDNPTQTLAGPVIVAGSGFTVTIVVVKHPVGSV